MIKIELSIDEANALVNLLDTAVRAGGIRIAPAAFAIMKKIEDAAKGESSSKLENL